MTDEHRVVTRRIQLAVHRIAQLDRLQRAARREFERLVLREGETIFDSRWLSGHFWDVC
jgi:hypothetical protein